MATGGDPGRKRAKSLFFSTMEDDDHAIYYLDKFHDTFIQLEDITEYRAAIELVGTWVEWNRLKRDWPAFRGFIQDWKDELEVKFRSNACAKVLALQSADSESVQLQAAKFLSSAEWDKRQVGAGRPSDKLKRQAAKELASVASETKEEESRMLKVINGGATK
jgi:hypothetical protein